MALPPGYELDKPAGGLPAGYTLDTPSTSKQEPTIGPRPTHGSWATALDPHNDNPLLPSNALDLVQGIGSGINKTGYTLGDAFTRGTNALSRKLGVPERFMSTPAMSDPEIRPLTQPPPSLSGKIGHYVEQAAEFLTPGGAVSKGAKAIEAASAGSKFAPAINSFGRALLESGAAGAVSGVQSGGDPNAIKSGMEAGFAAPAIANAAGAMLGKVASPFTPTPSAGAAAAKELNIPTLPSESAATGTWGRRMLERFLMNRALGREPFYSFKATQNQAAQGAASEVAGKLGESAPPAATGAAVGGAMAGQDQTALTGLAKAEADRVGALNADSIAQARAATTRNSDLARQATGANAQLESESAKAAAGANADALAKSKATSMLSGDLSQQAQGANTQLESMRTAAKSRVLNNLSDISDQVGPSLPHEQVGQGAQAAFKDSAQAFKAQAHQLYSAIDQATGNSAIDLSPIKDWMLKLRQDLSGFGGATASLKGLDVAKIIETADRWGKAPTVVSFSDASDALSALKSIGRENSSLINSRFPGAIKSLTSKLESQMQEAAGKAGVLDQYKQANAFYRQGATLFNESKVADLMDKNPEQLSSAIWRPNSITDVRDVHTALSSHLDVWQTVQRRGVEDLFERSMKNGELDGVKLRTEWSKLGKPVQEELVGKENWEAFDNNTKNLHSVSKPVVPFEVPKAQTPAPGMVKPKPISPFEAPSSTPVTPKLEKPNSVSLDLTSQQKSLRVLAAAHPEKLAENLTTKGAETLWPELQKSLSDNPALLNQVRRQSFESLVTRSLGQNLPDGSAVLNNKSLVKNWRELGPHVQSHIAGDQLPEVNRLMSAMNVIDLTKLPTLHNAIYGGVLDPAAITGGLVDLFKFGDWKGGAMAAGWMIAPKYMAKAFTTPGGVKWMTEGLSVPANSQAVLNWMAKGAAYTGLAVNNANHSLTPPPNAKQGGNRSLPAPPKP